ncbi:MAG: hypothetical protein DRO95_06220 [Candidatus Altiarchaeales archaeon]|nr:MAG: hypothetical protein DRO95_06220 [Candidatus Altiarchaeales archaeon]
MKEKIPFSLILVFFITCFIAICMGAGVIGNIEIDNNFTSGTGIIEPISGIQMISVDLYPGESMDTFVDVYNPLGKTARLRVDISGRVEDFIKIRNPTIILGSGERANVNLTLYVPFDAISGVYSGILSLRLDGRSIDIPTNIRVLQPQQPLLGIEIKPLTDTIAPGKKLPVQITIYNPHKIERSTTLSIQLLDSLSNDVLSESKTFPFIDRTVTLRENIEIPKDIEVSRIEGDTYILRASLLYHEANRTKEIEDLSKITVRVNIWEFRIFGIPFYIIPIILIISISLYLAYLIYKRKQVKKKRYLAGIDFTTLPRPGRRSAFIGRISETGIRAFFELDRLMEHCLVAGSTGAGKTVAAQDMVEEALINNISVLVFDPTAQWTGFLRPNRERAMFRLYPKFGMEKKDARGFNGSIKIVRPPLQEFNFKKYMNPGEITIFCLNHLNPEEIEEFMVEVILSVFRARLEESTRLKTLIVFDEVHRLLPKFGGTGKGLTQLERGVREFRKWGVGMILISQVLSDYPRDVEANVATEIQMRTRYEGDLNRIRMKYGENIMKSVLKAQVGTGMLQNSQYNHGRPYFITFRPLLHHPRRLSDKELDMYERYDMRIESLRNILDRAKKRGIDVFDLELELDLTLSNLKKGSFDIVDMYLESLEPRVHKLEEDKEEDADRGHFDNDWKRVEREIYSRDYKNI